MIPPPRSSRDLLARARALSGRTVAEVAAAVDDAVPQDPTRSKGWLGRLVETALGATGGPADVVDFPGVGVELKTIPVGESGRPRESTFVSRAPRAEEIAGDWGSSRVAAKLAAVLWVPVVTPRGSALGERRFGEPVLWRASAAQEAVLRGDWEELADLIRMGEGHRITAKLGEALQIRPKAASSRDRTWQLGGDGEWVQAMARGFYLRAGFTAGLIG